MIRVHKDFEATPPGLISDACNAQRLKAIFEKASHNFSSYHYRDSIIGILRGIYKYKCGYCETPESAGASLRVDHFRPKGRVIELSNHGGYYWLGYEWSNLILVCEKCNRQKWDHFPIGDETARVLQPTIGSDGLPISDGCRADKSLLINEGAFLLNPEIDDPDVHLLFLPDGNVKAKTVRGATSIDVYDLRRSPLLEDRKNMTDDILEKLKKHLLRFLHREIDEDTYRYVMQDVYDEAVKNRQPDKPYSRVANALFGDFETFVVAQFPLHQQPYIRQTFELYQKGKLWPRTQ
jgi:uncharacterized protein (TIGR02646 family)